MRQNIRSYIGLPVIYLVFFWILSGCAGGGGTQVRYYLLDPVESLAIQSGTDKTLAIEIINLHIPQYLERLHIAVRSGENRLRFSENNQWGENLRKNLMRTMARNLSSLLSTSDIATPLGRSSSVPDYRIAIYIDQFERDIDNIVRLSARWQLIDGADSQALGIHQLDLEGNSRVAENDYDYMVSEMRDLYGQLSRNIAETILVEAGK